MCLCNSQMQFLAIHIFSLIHRVILSTWNTFCITKAMSNIINVLIYANGWCLDVTNNKPCHANTIATGIIEPAVRSI